MTRKQRGNSARHGKHAVPASESMTGARQSDFRDTTGACPSWGGGGGSLSSAIL